MTTRTIASVLASSTTLAAAMLITTSGQALAGETVVDLDGGGLIVVTYREPGNEDDRFFEYTVPANETLRFTNGTMMEYEQAPTPGRGSTPQDYYRLIVNGTMIFGADFPEPIANLDYYRWRPTLINGSMIFDSPTVIRYQNFSPWTVATGAELTVNPGNNVRIDTDMSNRGTISVGSGASLNVGRIYGSLSSAINVAENARFSAALSGQTLNVSAGAEIVVIGNANIQIGAFNGVQVNLPAEGDVTLLYGPEQAIGGGTVSVADVPSGTASTFVRIADPDLFPFSAMMGTTVRLEQATGVEPGDAVLILGCESCDPMGNQISTLTLEAPADNGANGYALRWGAEGIYVLGTSADWCPADINSDGEVNFFDFAAYIGHFNNQSPWANTTEDDQDINFLDIATYLDVYNAGCP